MPTITINDDVINSAEAEAYFQRADHRIMTGLRATLELLGIAVPLYAVRRKPGRTPALDVRKAMAADHPEPRRILMPSPIKSTAPAAPQFVALGNTAAPGPGLYAQTFSK